MKKSALTVTLYIVSVYLLSLLLQEAYIHILIALVAIHLLISFSSLGEKEEGHEELEKQKHEIPTWKAKALLIFFLCGLIALNYFLPILELFGAL